MDIYTGNHIEIGKQIGAFYKRRRTKIHKPRINHSLFKSQIVLYKHHYAQKLDQLTATAKEAGYDTNDYLYLNICSDIDWHKRMSEPQKGCTIFGVQNESGTFVGRNYDWKPGTEEYFRIFESVNQDVFNYIGITDMDYFSSKDAKTMYLYYDIDDAINEKGLYIGLTFAYHDGVGVGLSPIHMNQLVAETCSTVEEALATFERVPLAVPKNFFIADSKGDMAVIEHTGIRFKVIRPSNGILIQTNHYLDPELAQEDTVLKHNELSSTYKRYSEALEKLTFHKDNIHQIGIEKILKDPQAEILENNRRMETIWSLALDMKGQQYRIYWNFFDALREEQLKF